MAREDIAMGTSVCVCVTVRFKIFTRFIKESIKSDLQFKPRLLPFVYMTIYTAIRLWNLFRKGKVVYVLI